MRPADFFRTIFSNSRGFVCIAVKKNTGFQEVFYMYPDQLGEMHEYVERTKYLGNVYFCPMLLSEPRRTKTNVVICTCAWADLDTCHPRELLVQPTIALESSPNRYQAFWSFDSPRNPSEGESVARRIAYYHADAGADRSGWDLTQLLRIPGTRNFKYGDGPAAPEVKVLINSGSQYRMSDFDKYPQAEGYEFLNKPMPQFIVQDGVKILERYSFKISGAAHTLFATPVEPGADRSAGLFRLQMLCLEAGMDETEVFQVARDSQLNKWPDRQDLLWSDTSRAIAMHSQNEKIASPGPPPKEPPLVTDQERRDVQADPGFVERYITWASELGDAAVQYHQGGALIALSSLLAGSITLPTSFGEILPNLWVCILADTTVTRKSTAMNITMDMLQELDENLVMATDGSIEGLMTALAARPGQVSVFFRDEFTGMLEQISKKDYMAGTAEFLTALYDGKMMTRRLRKEEIRVRDPRLVMFTGGIKSRMQSLVTFEQVSSGFLPRFIFITAMTDMTKVKPLGPPEEHNWGQRDKIKAELNEIRQHYRSQVPVTMGGKVVGVQEKITRAALTPDAWKRFNKIDQTLMQIGLDSGDLKDLLTPTYARLSMSVLKSAVLMAAARTREERLLVTEEDLIRAASYGDVWRQYAQDVIVNVGKGPLEHKLSLIGNAIQRNGRLPRSAIMQRYHLNANEMSLISRTLEERGLVVITQHGRQQILQSTLSEAEKVLSQ